MKAAMLAPVLMLLAGCAGSDPSRDAERCVAAGARPGSPAEKACVERLAQDRAERTRRAANAIPFRGFGPL
ncbi:hypothetical protein [Methylopila turkensis]|uniref:Lipoprotein n=1 Tax=Methylopila turkensis TaxID=1437816 RepID=A0A9W6N7E5_9HYPH|nr:hypothetical protein [Methylopila turkensis]GLK80335.1 hypothetical protein GCM10008174_20760 [Methylopila turkensis]